MSTNTETIATKAVFEKVIPFTKLFKTSIISVILIIAGIIIYFVKGGFELGIDFKGGVKIECVINNPEIDIKKLRGLFSSASMQAEINYVGNPEAKSFLITLPVSESNSEEVISKALSFLGEKFGNENIEVKGREIVEPKIGKTFAFKALQLLVIVSILLLFYILFRFDIFYSIGAIVALIHDALMMLVFTLFLKIPIDITIIAAILTVLGYSINDTIVVFDRIRELKQLTPQEEFSLLIDKATTQTLNRTIITSLTTIFVSLALYLFGGIVLKNFALILTIGFISGTYSSIFIAAFITYLLRKRFLKNP
ncbi:MAG: protein translocase subunit SecF [Brevinematia bacterium]